VHLALAAAAATVSASTAAVAAASTATAAGASATRAALGVCVTLLRVESLILGAKCEFRIAFNASESLVAHSMVSFLQFGLGQPSEHCDE
jgi:hypothetical protein